MDLKTDFLDKLFDWLTENGCGLDNTALNEWVANFSNEKEEIRIVIEKI